MMFYKVDASVNDAAYMRLMSHMPQDFNGRRLTNFWDTPDALMENGRLLDFLHCEVGAPVCSASVMHLLADMLADDVEFLPLNTNGIGSYYLMNIVRVFNCLDAELSGVKRFSDGRVYAVEKHVVDPESIYSNYFFKINEFSFTQYFCTERFLDIYNNNKLTGLNFSRIDSR